MKTTLLLADSAQVADGKLFILGGGWTDTVVGPDGHTVPHALAIIVNVPWDQTNRPHHVRCALVDSDGHVVEPAPGQPVQIENQFEVGRPPGAHLGAPIPFTIAANFGPLPLTPGRYCWELTVDDTEEWTTDVAFNVRPSGGPVRLVS